jgi:hypothetical protein
MSPAPAVQDRHHFETELLIRCARLSLDECDTERIQVLLQYSLNWDHLIGMADWHRVKSLLYRNLRALRSNAIAPAVLGRLQQECHAIALTNLALAAELVQLVAMFKSHGIDAISWKGPCVASLAYGDIAMRRFGDLDLLFRKSDFAAATRLLNQRGYQLALPMTPRSAEAHLEANNEIPFARGSDRIFVDVHTALTKRHVPLPLPFNELWKRRIAVSVGGQDVPTLSPEDHLLALSIHGAKHRWPCLGLIVDVAELVRRCPNLDWGLVTATARRTGCRRMLHLGLALAHDVLGASLPAEMAERMRSDTRAQRLAQLVRRNLFRERTAGLMESAIFDLQSRDRIRDGVRSFLSLAFTPNVSDAESLSLPASVSGLHYLLRPLRLAGKHFGKLVGMPRRVGNEPTPAGPHAGEARTRA